MSNKQICKRLSEHLYKREIKEFFSTLSNMLKSRGGLTEVSEYTGLNRESLYKVLRGDRDPRLSTILELVDYLGVEIQLVPTARALEDKLSHVSGFEAPWLEMFHETPKERLENADRAIEQFRDFNE